MKRPVRIANCSGFYGDRLSAAREMVEGGPIDVLTGDWLAELTMLIMARARLKNGPGSGFARTFLACVRPVLATCAERGIRVVVNAGGLDPAGCATELRGLADTLGLRELRIAHVIGDDLVGRWAQLRDAGCDFVNIDTGEVFGADVPLTANAYLGGRAISAALAAGADVVITGRVTDAALVIGPAAWWHDWSYDSAEDLNAMAGALVAGHVIECGTQATGGNYAFFTDVPGIDHLGFPWAEIAADGSSVIGKHDDGTGGLVDVGTVTAQLLYEIGPPAYVNPDAVADFRSITLTEVGPDRVAIGSVVGLPAPADLKVAINTLGGLRNSMTLVVTGLDIEAKADVALRATCGVTWDQASTLDPATLAGISTLAVDRLDVELLRYDRLDPTFVSESQAMLRLVVTGTDIYGVGRGFTSPVIESTLASYPGMFPTTPPGPGTPFGSYWPATVPAHLVAAQVFLDHAGVVRDVATVASAGFVGPGVAAPDGELELSSYDPANPQSVPLGTFVGARSGDKGGNANIGLWIRRTDPELDAARYSWLATTLDEQAIRRLLPEAAALEVAVYHLPKLLALNVVIVGLLGRGVAETNRLDPQAKGLGEHLRARLVKVPAALLGVVE